MPKLDGVPGMGVTPLVDGQAVTQTWPLPVYTTAGGFGPGVSVGVQQTFLKVNLAAGDNILVAAVAGKRIFVTGYNFSLPAADTAGFYSNPGAAAPISAQGVGVVGGNEAVGGEPYLFATAAGQSLNFRVGLAAATGNVQVRYRVEN